ncbi:energy transducer TonB [Hymenobacter cellulosilyticus]|uniref:TonB family protein n=1 Tax=Hymenobacter cellulosilyticus TaxID=2932248 RepID=A0A8T9Q9P4_9BACT|nr:energy transducer TonB [Hymenobacter cellulosilyticus]UOQ74286.1 TonB family protein [Hymenobacter cellulosilyticus]
MRHLLFCSTLLLGTLLAPTRAAGQSSARTYYTSASRPTTAPDSAAYYTVVRKQGVGGSITTYRPDGRRLHQQRYSQLQVGRRQGLSTEWDAGTGRRVASYPYSQGHLHGVAQAWYPSGRLRWQLSYQRGQRHGTLRAWHPSGRLLRADTYRAGQRIGGHCYTRAGRDTTWFAFERPAQFPGGPVALQQWLSTHIRYPALALRNQVEGNVWARFVVDAHGQLVDGAIVKGIGAGTDEEVLRLLRSMPAWKPAVVAGQPVAVTYTLPIEFRLL